MPLIAAGIVAASAPAFGQSRPVPRIGILYAQTEISERHPIEAALEEVGYADGRTASIERRWAEGRFDRMPTLADQIVRIRPDIIVAQTTAAALALKRATATIPILVMSSGDAVGSGLVESLARPGGNVTGNSFLGPDLAVKQVDLVQSLVPGIKRLSFVANAALPPEMSFLRQMRDVASRFGLEVDLVDTRRPDDFTQSIGAVIRSGAEAVVFAPGGYSDNAQDRRRLMDAVETLRIPSMFFRREFVEIGGMLSYGPDFTLMYRQTANYVDRILKGANPAELPVVQPSSFTLVINQRTAQRLGMTLPSFLIVRADEVIE